ncbi:hypothetical protein RHSIM_RhsimUnG0091800 [Rhododendron simsii]|uniref:F-box associated domain-containing protein n=1 Tax=Rhododendron simsii TaxID=118357 RepID=A0A834FYL4_RHOSS|nr:hypothetical protein RHSIM_RhsimUnG0091800 [Rhododendron simsii]
MDEDCCQWNVKFLVDLKTLISEFPEMESRKVYKFTVMCAVKGEKENDFALILGIPETLLVSKKLVTNMEKNEVRPQEQPIADITPPETSPAAELIANNVDLLAQILLRIPVAKSLIRFKPAFPSLWFLRRPEFVILHSYNGLLLIKNNRFVDDRFVKARYIVCNPTTKKYSVLSHPGGGYYASGWLAFDPSKSPHYIVVLPRPIRPASTPSLEIDIFSSETACWKKIFLQERCYTDGAFWNGAVYWLCDQYNLLGFDVEMGKMARWLTSVEFEILAMDKDQCRWNVKFRVNLRPLISAFPQTESRNDKATVMGVVEGEKEDDLALVLAIPGKVISYNLQKKTWNVLRDLAPK